MFRILADHEWGALRSWQGSGLAGPFGARKPVLPMSMAIAMSRLEPDGCKGRRQDEMDDVDEFYGP